MRVVLPVDSRWTPEYQQRLNSTLEAALARLNEYALIPEGGTSGQSLVKASDRSLDLEWGAGSSADYVLKSTTNLGTVNTAGLDIATNTAAEWSALPVGYSCMMNAGNVAGGAPDANYGFFTKVASRDVGGGWGGLWVGHAGAENYVGYAVSGTDLPTWRRLVTDSSPTLTSAFTFNGAVNVNSGMTLSRATGGSVSDDIIILRTGAGGSAVGTNTWLRLHNSTDNRGIGLQTSPTGGAVFWSYNGSAWINPITITTSGMTVHGGRQIDLWNTANSAGISVRYNEGTTYSALEVTGKKNGHAGVAFTASYNGGALMLHESTNECGIWDSVAGWRFRTDGQSLWLANSTKAAAIAQWANCKITRGTVAASGGSDGDIYLRYGASRGIYVNVLGTWELVAS
jgi:hypothetical protein